MPLWLNKLFGWLLRSPCRLKCDREVWTGGVAELRRRTLNGRRESGAFLLGKDEGSYKRILEFVFYDDVDPRALDTGIVHITSKAQSKLWAICRQRGYGVVADVHVHPGSYFQSESDMENPVMLRAGHYALIIPHFARREVLPGGIGMYEFLGGGQWRTHTATGPRFFKLESSQ